MTAAAGTWVGGRVQLLGNLAQVVEHVHVTPRGDWYEAHATTYTTCPLTGKPRGQVGPPVTGPTVAEVVHGAIMAMLDHEVRECLVVDGVRVLDPHAGEAV